MLYFRVYLVSGTAASRAVLVEVLGSFGVEPLSGTQCDAINEKLASPQS